MKLKVLITVSSLLLLVISCEKDSSDFDYGSTYYKSYVDKTTLIRYYTYQGEITNGSVINNFYSEDTAQFGYYLEYVMSKGYFDTLIIPSPNEVSVKNYGTKVSYRASKEGSRLIFKQDSIVAYSGGDEFSRSPEYYLLQYKPKIYSEWLYSSTRGDYVFAYLGEYINVVAADGDKINFPVILSRQRRAGKYPISEILNNYLDREFWKKIMPGDTLTLLETKMHYEKK